MITFFSEVELLRCTWYVRSSIGWERREGGKEKREERGIEGTTQANGAQDYWVRRARRR